MHFGSRKLPGSSAILMASFLLLAAAGERNQMKPCSIRHTAAMMPMVMVMDGGNDGDKLNDGDSNGRDEVDNDAVMVIEKQGW